MFLVHAGRGRGRGGGKGGGGGERGQGEAGVCTCVRMVVCARTHVRVNKFLMIFSVFVVHAEAVCLGL